MLTLARRPLSRKPSVLLEDLRAEAVYRFAEARSRIIVSTLSRRMTRNEARS
jgi:hypothetical protein